MLSVMCYLERKRKMFTAAISSALCITEEKILVNPETKRDVFLK